MAVRGEVARVRWCARGGLAVRRERGRVRGTTNAGVARGAGRVRRSPSADDPARSVVRTAAARRRPFLAAGPSWHATHGAQCNDHPAARSRTRAVAFVNARCRGEPLIGIVAHPTPGQRRTFVS